MAVFTESWKNVALMKFLPKTSGKKFESIRGQNSKHFNWLGLCGVLVEDELHKEC